jgi:8-oxo-dGTP pyrophosphatase MutT (NUDIX family)
LGRIGVEGTAAKSRRLVSGDFEWPQGYPGIEECHMTEVPRISRVGFVTVKLRAGGTAYYLMRQNAKWKDLNFIGGHAKDRDSDDLKKTARRELWEEVPSIRAYSKFDLEPLTETIHHGPIYSRSKGDSVEYNLQFFLLRIEGSPVPFVEALSTRTRNVWVSESEMLAPQKYRLSGLVGLLHGVLPGGLRNIPFSSATDLSPWMSYLERADYMQLEFALK